MTIARWTPPVAPSRQEQLILKRLDDAVQHGRVGRKVLLAFDVCDESGSPAPGLVPAIAQRNLNVPD